MSCYIYGTMTSPITLSSFHSKISTHVVQNHCWGASMPIPGSTWSEGIYWAKGPWKLSWRRWLLYIWNKGWKSIQICLEEVITNPTFKDLDKSLLWLHSFRKDPATYVSSCRVASDIAMEGGWRGNKKQVDVYIYI